MNVLNTMPNDTLYVNVRAGHTNGSRVQKKKVATLLCVVWAHSRARCNEAVTHAAEVVPTPLCGVRLFHPI